MWYRSCLLLSFSILFVVPRFSLTAIIAGNKEQSNETRPFKLHVTRLICIDLPYAETTVNECRVILRRNQRSLMKVSINVPKVYNFLLLQYRLHYKFTTFQPLLIDGELEVCSYMRGPKTSILENYIYGVMSDLLSNTVYPCPHGNKTYTEITEFKEEYAPKSIPAGDYRMDLRFASKSNVTLLWLQGFATVKRRGIMGSINEEQRNVTRPFKLQVTRVLCVDTPYAETTVNECRVILRRNQRSLISVSINVPKVYNFLLLQYRLHYKFTTYRPLFIDGVVEVCSYLQNPMTNILENYIYCVMSDLLPNSVYPCPHGNKTYTEKIEFKEEYAPKSIPAGDYRLDLRFASKSNKNLTRRYTIQVMRMLYLDMPYVDTVVEECRVVLRCNQRCLMKVSAHVPKMQLLHGVIHVPKVYTYIVIQYNLYYKSKTFQPILINGQFEACATLRDYERGPNQDPLTDYVVHVLKHVIPTVLGSCLEGLCAPIDSCR
uniref:Uncharacterized protein n=1 Tax=Anopheles stephensi TaxID=30069 RepID=A0A182Y6N1_ANOST